jgi:hypothetical protein
VASAPKRRTWPSLCTSPQPPRQSTTSSQSWKCGGVAAPGAMHWRQTESWVRPSASPAQVLCRMPGRPEAWGGLCSISFMRVSEKSLKDVGVRRLRVRSVGRRD